MNYLITMKDLSVRVMQLIDNAEIDDELKKWPDVDQVLAYRPIKNIELPKNREFRGAWRHEGDVIDIDMPRARAIHLNRIRDVRNRLLEASDKALMRAQEQGHATEALVTYRKDLRDLPQTLDLSKATTAEALAEIWPEILEKKDS